MLKGVVVDQPEPPSTSAACSRWTSEAKPSTLNRFNLHSSGMHARVCYNVHLIRISGLLNTFSDSSNMLSSPPFRCTRRRARAAKGTLSSCHAPYHRIDFGLQLCCKERVRVTSSYQIAAIVYHLMAAIQYCRHKDNTHKDVDTARVSRL